MDSRDKRRTGPPAPCACCGEVGQIMARGLKESCYSRLMRYGGDEAKKKYPPTRPSAKYTLEKGRIIDRAEQYRELTTGTGALGRNEACRVLGVSVRTGYRYEAWIQGQMKEEESGSD